MSNVSIFDPQLVNLDTKPVATAYYFKTWNGFAMSYAHAHNAVEIMYVLSGSCRVYVNSAVKNLSRNDMIIIETGVSHRLIVDKGINCRMLNIEFRFRNPQHNVRLHDADCIIFKDHEEILYILKDLVLEHQHDMMKSEEAKQVLFRYLFLKLSRYWTDNRSVGNDAVSGYVKKALEFIHNNYDRQLKVSDIADHVNINLNYLQRIFKKQMTDTIIGYLTYLRIEKAKLLLNNTDIPVTDISAYIGISSRQYFSFLFSKYCGMSPSEFRKKSEYLTSSVEDE
ncbi:MAG: AraC family transcriptional regulator [Eubacteriales bacterium]|jgi:AraC-like DNA-binding protein/mannose-6-phosphate isomerase-like protein (cupin superfamily)|nr:AraC family transcriptional regulator [Eubacteriales bacterium]MDD4718096.1 AraC family transcriptional regulator [Eubacteriales bacterium]